LKVRYVCECCGDLIRECQDRVNWPESIGNAENTIESSCLDKSVVVKSMCDDCLIALGRTDDGFTGWISGVNVFRH
jgi:hypothetical protein